MGVADDPSGFEWHPRVASTLAAYGFTEADLNDGWSRLRALSGKRLATKTQPVADPRLIEQLDAFENRWFPIASATLRRHHPEVADWLFLNLSQTEGLEVIVSVSTFLERLRSPPEQTLPGAAARELLAARGLPYPLFSGLAFITNANNVNLRTKTMTNVPRKHVGIFFGATTDIWHYSNSRRQVVRQQPSAFSNHYAAPDNAMFWGTVP